MLRLSEARRLIQTQVFDAVQQTLDVIAVAPAKGEKAGLCNFGVGWTRRSPSLALAAIQTSREPKRQNVWLHLIELSPATSATVMRWLPAARSCWNMPNWLPVSLSKLNLRAAVVLGPFVAEDIISLRNPFHMA